MTHEELQAAFVAQLEMLRAAARRRFGRFRCKDTREDMVAEVVALAWQRWVSLNRRGLDARRFAGVTALRVCASVYRGRCLASYHHTSEPLSLAAQRARGFAAFRLPEEGRRSELVSDDELIDRKGADPAQLGGCRVDFAAFRTGLSDYRRCVLGFAVQGYGHNAIARHMGACPGSVRRVRVAMAEQWRASGVEGE